MLSAFPGLADLHRALCTAVAQARPQRSLPKMETTIEAVVRSMLGVDGAPSGDLWRAVAEVGALPAKAPAGYQPFLPCPLWADAFVRDDSAPRKKLLLVLTDGKPNDVNYCEGCFAIQDSRKAVQEARRAATCVFGVTIDADAHVNPDANGSIKISVLLTG